MLCEPFINSLNDHCVLVPNVMKKIIYTYQKNIYIHKYNTSNKYERGFYVFLCFLLVLLFTVTPSMQFNILRLYYHYCILLTNDRVIDWMNKMHWFFFYNWHKKLHFLNSTSIGTNSYSKIFYDYNLFFFPSSCCFLVSISIRL